MKQWKNNLMRYTEKGIQKELSKIGKEIQAESQRLVPVVSGKLSESITIVLEKDRVSVGSGLEYAMMVEFGTRFQPPQPYFRPALQIIINRYNKR